MKPFPVLDPTKFPGSGIVMSLPDPSRQHPRPIRFAKENRQGEVYEGGIKGGRAEKGCLRTGRRKVLGGLYEGGIKGGCVGKEGCAGKGCLGGTERRKVMAKRC